MSKFASIFTPRPLKPVAELQPGLTPAMKAARSAESDERPQPQRRFVTLSSAEQARYPAFPHPMWVETSTARRRRTLWSAPNEATWLATNHNDPAPSDEDLIAAGWRKQAGVTAESGAAE
ncbi:hypothetical protein [Bosea sp. AK1]|uniref:hypothetical protein n=1 Tax=Bosea sp. AK1 TaxID=2587160 RepID=UPI00114E275C|nr:hypothetical protein [Bosea sp. AK1]